MRYQCKAACDESKLSCDIHSLDNLCGHCSNHIENIFPLPPHYSQGIILVYDITSERTFDNIPHWLTDVERVGVRVYIFDSNLLLFFAWPMTSFLLTS